MSDSVVFFDGVCNLCNSYVQWLIRRDKKQVLTYSSLQSNYAQNHITDPAILATDSIVYFYKQQYYTKSTAVIYILRTLGFPYNLSLLLLIVPKFLRDWVYDTVARNRYKWFGKRATCMLPDPSLKNRFLE
jgi:predicted DCC family thiol-disulfide oxidoreductase YuxK